MRLRARAAVECASLLATGLARMLACRRGALDAGSDAALCVCALRSPCLKLKPHSKGTKAGFLTVNVEPYGGGLWHTWFDRDLSVAGRVLLRDGDRLQHRLVSVWGMLCGPLRWYQGYAVKRSVLTHFACPCAIAPARSLLGACILLDAHPSWNRHRGAQASAGA